LVPAHAVLVGGFSDDGTLGLKLNSACAASGSL
jgi:hypothetical protein